MSTVQMMQYLNTHLHSTFNFATFNTQLPKHYIFRNNTLNDELKQIHNNIITKSYKLLKKLNIHLNNDTTNSDKKIRRNCN